MAGLAVPTYDGRDEVAEALADMASYFKIGEMGYDEATITDRVLHASVGGATSQFTGVINLSTEGPVVPGTVVIEDQTSPQAITDDGNGNLIGDIDPLGTNHINYNSGEYDVTFAGAPPDDVHGTFNHRATPTVPDPSLTDVASSGSQAAAVFYGQRLTDPIITLDATHYNIAVNVDGGGAVNIDVTGDLGVAGSYALADIVTNINTALGTTIVEKDTANRLVFTSTTTGPSSTVEFSAPTVNDGTNRLLGLDQGAYSHSYSGRVPAFFSYQKSFGADATTTVQFLGADTGKCRCVCFLDLSEAIDNGHSDPHGPIPHFFEVGIFDADDNMLAYGTIDVVEKTAIHKVTVTFDLLS